MANPTDLSSVPEELLCTESIIKYIVKDNVIERSKKLSHLQFGGSIDIRTVDEKAEPWGLSKREKQTQFRKRLKPSNHW